ncbi:MAG: glutamate 5-kinase [Alphaproteobacteria bacterium GM202ARS2]|nr:glutamate 5-kinase [Alphaproteobacteria bacterium GM202ARS2]
MTKLAPFFKASQRLVVKVGSRLLVGESDLRPDQRWLQHLAAELMAQRAAGKDVVVVSSGAVALGCRLLGKKRSTLRRLKDKQAAAALGQGALLSAWRDAFADYNVHVAQVLLSLDDTEDRQRALNARATFDSLLRFSVVPLVNENDTVATDEIRFGDNDRLAARIAQMIAADMLVLLSDVDGLYTASPRQDKGARHIPVIESLTPEIMKMAGLSDSESGSGGMVTKLQAARLATSVGCGVVIASGHEKNPLQLGRAGYRCSWFVPKKVDRKRAYKGWLLGGLRVRGSVHVDRGALEALRLGKSLLPAGVIAVQGNFQRGDMVRVVHAEKKDKEEQTCARGLASYSSHDVTRIMGRRSSDIESILGYSGGDEVIHRDHLVLA